MKEGLHPVRPADLYALHDMFKEWGQIDDETATIPDLARWYNHNVQEAVKVVHGRVIVGVVWLDCIYPGCYASMNLMRNPRRPVCEFERYCPAVLGYFFERHDLRKIIGITWRREALFFARRFGFRIDGTLREHAMVEGEWRDFKMTSILRTEFNARFGAPPEEETHGKVEPALTAAARAAA